MTRTPANQPQRCAWATTPLGIVYHDREWGVPVHDDRTFFEFLTLEGAQAGLSWETILKKREAYREAFAGFDPARVARFSPAKLERLLQNPGIVRNRLKVLSAVSNAKAFLGVQREFGSFDAYVWRFVGGAARVNGGGRSSRSRQARRSRTRSAATCSPEASSSSVRRSVTPSCRRLGWSTTTPSIASGTAWRTGYVVAARTIALPRRAQGAHNEPPSS